MKKILGKDVKLIFRRSPFSSYPPVLNESLAIVNADNGICITHINNKKHMTTSFLKFGYFFGGSYGKKYVGFLDKYISNEQRTTDSNQCKQHHPYQISIF